MFRAFIMTMGMFTIIPVNAWYEDCKKLVLPMLPVVGIVIGVLWYLFGTWLFGYNGNGSATVLIGIFPQALSGFIHLDGLMDVCDAVFSRRELSRRREILKDPHTGAFGVISAIICMLLNISGTYDAVGNYWSFLFIPIVSRAVAALSLMSLKSISDTGYGAMFKSEAHRLFIVAFAILSMAMAFYLGAGLPVIAAVITGILSAFYFYRQLGGISGDVCGAIICVSETAGLLSIGGLR